MSGRIFPFIGWTTAFSTSKRCSIDYKKVRSCISSGIGRSSWLAVKKSAGSSRSKRIANSNLCERKRPLPMLRKALPPIIIIASLRLRGRKHQLDQKLDLRRVLHLPKALIRRTVRSRILHFWLGWRRKIQSTLNRKRVRIRNLRKACTKMQVRQKRRAKQSPSHMLRNSTWLGMRSYSRRMTYA